MSPKPPADTEIISRPDQVRALSSQTRPAIHQIVLSQGEVSIREIAEQLGRKPVSLYRHIDQLVAVGVLDEVGTRSTARRDAKTYATKLGYLKYDPDDTEMVDALCGVTKCMFKSSAFGVIKSFESKDAVTHGIDRDTYLCTLFAWLDDDELKEVNEHLRAIRDVFKNKQRKPEAKLMAITVGMHPMPVVSADDN